MSTPITWRSPRDLSASKGNNIIDRAKHYRFNLKHHLKDGTRIIPKLSTVFSVLQAYDTFGLDVPLVICVDSYDVPTMTQIEDLDQINS